MKQRGKKQSESEGAKKNGREALVILVSFSVVSKEFNNYDNSFICYINILISTQNR